MITSAGIRKEYHKHFLLDEAKLRKIREVIQKHGEKLEEPTVLEFTVERENDSFYTTRDIEEVLSDENTPGRAIQTLTIELNVDKKNEPKSPSHEQRQKTRCYVSFSTGKRNMTVYFFATHEDRDWCFLLAEDLDTQFQRLLKNRPFRFLPGRYLDLVVALILGVVVLIGLIYFGSQMSHNLSLEEISAMTVDERTQVMLEHSMRGSDTILLLLPLSLVMMMLLAVIVDLRPLSRLLEKISHSCFYWGDTVATYESFQRLLVRVKWGIGIAFVVSLLATLVGALFLRG